MRTLGIGVDIIDNSRIKKSITNKKFISRIFSNDEINRSKKIINKAAFFSKRFAAKEAFSKALGTGFRKNINFKDIEVLKNHYGKPYILINKKVINKIKTSFKVKKFNILLSISDETNYSIASVIISK